MQITRLSVKVLFFSGNSSVYPLVCPHATHSLEQEVVQDLDEELTNEEIMEMITYFKVRASLLQFSPGAIPNAIRTLQPHSAQPPLEPRARDRDCSFQAEGDDTKDLTREEFFRIMRKGLPE